MKKIKLLLIIFFFALMIFNYSTEPLPPPYHQFHITGKIICDTLADKSNYTITLYGKSEFTNGKYIKPFRYPDGINNLALTDSAGNYYLIAKNEFEFDSIKVAIIQPGKEPIFSQPCFVDKANRKVIYKQVGGYDNNTGCCSNYSVDVPQQDVAPERYEYHLSNIIINLCKQ
jgi:hypothetical protein